MRTVTFTVLAVLLASNLHAAEVGARWRVELISIDKLLHERKYLEAQKAVATLTNDMMEHIGASSGATYTFAVTVAFCALAEAGLGHTEDADWYWCVATGLFPQFEQSDLSVYGDAGSLLMAITRGLSTTYADVKRLHDAPDDSGKVEAPRVVKRVEPRCPPGALSRGLGGPIVVEVTISRDGTPHRPRVVSSRLAPSLAYAALEALRQWRFEPGRLNGEPVAVIFNLTVNFRQR